MVGIYKIYNKINGHCYIGQSRNIEKRWKNHICASKNENDVAYNYPLYRAFRKYDISNFDFLILEECSIEELNEKEIFWISLFKPEYNQTLGGNYKIVPNKLNHEQVLEIQNRLIADKEGVLSHKELAEEYNVHKDTIRDINVGRTWYNPIFKYPLHYSKFDATKPKELKKINYCIDCGIEISKGASRCQSCESKNKITKKPLTREELKEKIRNMPFTEIGKLYNVTDNSVRKWCDRYNLPRTKKDIKAYSDEEWALI